MTTSAYHIQTGPMRHRAELQQKTRTADGGGGHSVAWSLVRKIWCEIVPLNGKQRLEADKRESQVTHHIFARYAADITADKRIVYGAVAYNISAVWSPKTRKEFLQILATEGVAT